MEGKNFSNNEKYIQTYEEKFSHENFIHAASPRNGINCPKCINYFQNFIGTRMDAINFVKGP